MGIKARARKASACHQKGEDRRPEEEARGKRESACDNGA